MERHRQRKWKLDGRGDMGIGTLILFIAMVLVAVVAASVIIQTAGNLQQQGQETGHQATRDVAGGLEIMSVIGDRHTDGSDSGSNQDCIQVLEVRVALTSGSPDIDFDEMVIHVSDGNESMDLTFNATGTGAGNASGSVYAATAVRDADGSWADDNVITRGDLILIYLCTDSVTTLELDNNIEVWIQLIPEAGETTYETFTTANTPIGMLCDRYG